MLKVLLPCLAAEWQAFETVAGHSDCLVLDYEQRGMEAICQTPCELNFEAEWQRRLEVLSKSRESCGHWVKRNACIRVEPECIVVERSSLVNRVRRELAFRRISVNYH